jgi:hypothetical protein
MIRTLGTQPVPAVLGMRLIALLGIALIVRYLPRLARLAGASPSTALWLTVLNPLVLAHLVAGAHNDALMIGLMVAGVAIALEGAVARGAVLIALAALVKAPAAVALAFIVPAVADVMPGRRHGARLAAAIGVVSGSAMFTAILATALSGAGYGWVHALETPTVVRNGLSVSTDVGILVGKLLDDGRAMGVARAGGGTLAIAVVVLALWRVRRIGASYALGIALTAAVLLGPVVHPWYLTWGFTPLAGTDHDRRVRQFMVGGSLLLTYIVLPTGTGPTPGTLVGAVIGLAAGIALLAVGHRLSQIPEGQPIAVHAKSADHPGGYRRYHRMVSELLAGVDVGDVHLDQRRPQQGTRIAQRVGVVRPGRRVQHDRHTLVGSGVQPGQQFGLGVGLADVDVEAQFLADAHTPLGQVGVAGEAVDVDLAGAQPPQVGSVEHVDLHRHTSAYAARRRSSAGESRMDG